jgi:hypothetical protein
VRVIGGAILQSLFCYCTEFEEKTHLNGKAKEINKSRYVEMQPVMSGLFLTVLGVLTIVKCMRDCVVSNRLYVFF